MALISDYKRTLATVFGEPVESLHLPCSLGHPTLGDAGDGVGRYLPGNSEMWGITSHPRPFLQIGTPDHVGWRSDTLNKLGSSLRGWGQLNVKNRAGRADSCIQARILCASTNNPYSCLNCSPKFKCYCKF